MTDNTTPLKIIDGHHHVKINVAKIETLKNTKKIHLLNTTGELTGILKRTRAPKQWVLVLPNQDENDTIQLSPTPEEVAEFLFNYLTNKG